MNWNSKLNRTASVLIAFDDNTIMDDVVTIDEFNTTAITVGSAYV